MNILVLCTSPNKGGLELYAQRSITIIEELGHFCISVINRKLHQLDQTINNRSDNHKNSALLSLSISNHILPIYSAYKLAKIIDRNNIDIIHIHWSRDFNLAVLAKITSKRHVKLIYTRHMAITRYKNDSYHKFLYSQVDCFITITKQLEKEANEFLPLLKTQIQLLYHGVSASKSENIICKQFYNATDSLSQFNIALFGRIEEGKGQHLLVEAIHNLKNKDIHVSIIGHVMDEKYFSEIKRKIENYNLTKQFHFHHFIEQAASYMKCFDAIVLTTYSETFGLVLIEAMLSGVAVIGSNSGGVPEIINDKITGLLFNSRDINSLANKIEFYYENPVLRKEIAKQGQRYVKVNFSEQQHTLKYNKILMELS